ncbi:MAG: carbon-nitrogen hydrolase family protein [Alphaproteobacteria bacterium]|nr:carbon-nitrogen hydrolase family protein [Alphaproteobacteria bacterium]
MKKRAVFLAALIGITAAATLGYALWRCTDRPLTGVQPFNTGIAAYDVIGADGERGNFVAVQPWMTPGDYANTETLFAKLDGYFAAAKAKGWLNAKTIVVLPEYIGSWLAAADEPASVYSAAHAGPAMATLALTHPLAFLRWYLSAPAEADKTEWTLFTLKAEVMARDYQSLFSALAKKYAVTLVAGSIVLPQPHLEKGRIVVTPGGSLYNVSALFAPDGTIAGPLVFKAYPIAEEQAFLAAGKVSDIPVFDTPDGKLAVLICADSWYPPSYQRIAQLGAQLLAIPSYSTVDDSWAAPWAGYDGQPAPADVNRHDIGRITLGEAWLKYSMGGRAGAAKIQTGINVFLRGKLWDLGTDGDTISYRDGKASHVAGRHGAILINQWL